MKTIGVLWFFCVFSCQNSSKIETEIANIQLDLRIERFDQIFGSSTPSELPALKQKYPFLFAEKFADTVWFRRMNDPIQHLLTKTVDSVFKDFSSTESEIKAFYQHLKYYNKAFQMPRLITVLSDVDYRNKAIVTDSIVLIALDNYLGPDHEFYSSFYGYIKQNLDKNQLLPDLATAYAEQLIHQSKRSIFLDELIYFGKQLYLKDVWIPFKEKP